MADRDRIPLDEEEPIPGSPRSRVSLVVGLLLMLGILVALVWFAASNLATREAGSLFGS